MYNFSYLFYIFYSIMYMSQISMITLQMIEKKYS